MSDRPTTTLHSPKPSFAICILAEIQAFLGFLPSLIWTFLLNQFPSLRPVVPTQAQIEREAKLAHERRRYGQRNSVSSIASAISSSSTLVDGGLPGLPEMNNRNALSRITEQSSSSSSFPPSPTSPPPFFRTRSRTFSSLCTSFNNSITKPVNESVQKFGRELTVAVGRVKEVGRVKDVGRVKEVQVQVKVAVGRRDSIGTVTVPKAPRLPSMKRFRSFSFNDVISSPLPPTTEVDTTTASPLPPTPPHDEEEDLPEGPKPTRRSSISKRLSATYVSSLNALRISIPNSNSNPTSTEKEGEMETYQDIYAGMTDSHHPHPCTNLGGEEPKDYFVAPDSLLSSTSTSTTTTTSSLYDDVEADSTSTKTTHSSMDKKVAFEEVVTVISETPKRRVNMRMKRTMTRVKSVFVYHRD